MTTIDTVKAYIKRLCTEAGADPENIYQPEADAWYFQKGTVTIEVFLETYETEEKVLRSFIRCLSAFYPIPVEPAKRQEVYFVALEVNTRNMGVKIGTMADNGYMYAIAEREIDSMEYPELVTLINDVGNWADQLGELFRGRFGEPESNLN